MEIEKAIKQSVEELISEELDKEIEKRTIEFHKELVSRKDRYIAEVMKGIRIVHEYNAPQMCDDYRILFLNKYEVK